MRRSRGPFLGSVAVALLLASCTMQVNGTLTKLEEPLTAREALGDLNTVDYCSVLDEARIKKAGGILMPTPSTGFSYCTFEVSLPRGGHRLTVLVGNPSYESKSVLAATPDEVVPLRGGVRVQRYESFDPGACMHSPVFPDDITFEVKVYGDGVPQRMLCRFAGAVMDGLWQAVRAGRIGRLDFHAGSLAEVGACSLLSDQEVARAVGPGADRVPPPIGHFCGWGVGNVTDDPWVFVEYSSYGLSDEPQFPTTVGGRIASVEQADGHCVVRMPHVDWPNEDYAARELLIMRGALRQR